MEGWPKYNVRLAKGALMVTFTSTNSDSIEREAQRLEKMGLKRGDHFTVKMPDGGKTGYVNILKEGLAYAAWLSENSEDKEQRELARGVCGAHTPEGRRRQTGGSAARCARKSRRL
jgi:predicted secreted protein